MSSFLFCLDFNISSSARLSSSSSLSSCPSFFASPCTILSPYNLSMANIASLIQSAALYAKSSAPTTSIRWWGHASRSSCVGLLAPTCTPRYACTLSADTMFPAMDSKEDSDCGETPPDRSSWEAIGDLQSDMATELLPTPVGPAMTTTSGLRSVAASAAGAPAASECDGAPLPSSTGSGRFMLRVRLKCRNLMGLGGVEGDGQRKRRR
mmetsp:Transcript_10648/g.29954  ORF Transcript_10648/g.29954 Transcript_10648/m.29954 type:complete len:209 (-) Transcript_10648:11-637(-)